MAEPRSTDPEAVRDLVRKIVDATLGTGPDDAPSADTSAAGPIAIAIGADHGGWELKDRIGAVLTEDGYVVRDCGTNGPDAVDYPDFAHAVARLVATGTCRWGIVIDGAGIGSAMTANKVPGVRAANCHDLSSARNSREHNYANVLTLGARFLGEGLAMDIVRTWLDTDWGAARHGARVEKITQIERHYDTGAPEGRAR
ncbi:MAG: ribose 5-phosphate isomerase B [Chloroflexota bacterium]